MRPFPAHRPRRASGVACLAAARTSRATKKTAAPLAGAEALPPRFQAWFEVRGWQPPRHQLEMVGKGREGRSALLIPPTGGGKTLAGFLPSLIEISERPPANDPAGYGVHTLYISPLKALAVDVARNLTAPVQEMGLKVSVESRTGDTGVAKKARQRVDT